MAPPKAELLVWFVLMGRLNIRDHLIRLNVLHGDDDQCVLCKNHAEDLNHLFLAYPISWRVWGPCCQLWGLS